MSTPTQLPPVNTVAALEEQRRRLEEEGKKKQEAIASLQEVQHCFAFATGQIGHATQATQALLAKPAFQKPLQHHLQPASPKDPAEQLKELMAVTQRVEKREIEPAMDEYIVQLNKAVGTTRANAKRLEEEAAQLDTTIALLQANIEQRKKDLVLTANYAYQISRA